MGKVSVALTLAAVVLLTGVAGTAQTIQPSQAWIPALGSFLIPGLGQLLNDEIDKAIFHFAVDVGILALGWYLGGLLPMGYYTIPTLHLAWGLYSGYDAYIVAEENNFRIGMVPNGIVVSYSY